MLQNEDYIKFAEENTVEIISLSRLDEALNKSERNADEERKVAEYDAKDENGKPVKYMVQYAGMTREDMLSLARSKAGQFNDTGKIPFVCIVDPYTEKEMARFPGGRAAKGMMEAAEAQKKVLNSAHGPSVSRTLLKKVDAELKRITEGLPKAGVAKSMAEYRKLEKSIAKEGEGIKSKLAPVLTAMIEVATAQLDEADGLIGTGDLPGAKKILDKLGKSLDGTELEARAKELAAKVKV